MNAKWLLIFMLVFFNGVQAEIYYQIHLDRPDLDVLKRVALSGIDGSYLRYTRNGGINLIVSDSELVRLRAMGVDCRILVEDIQNHYRRRDAGILHRWADDYDSLGIGLPQGSMGGYYTLSEIYRQLDSLHHLYPYIIGEAQSVGQSIEGRDIFCYRISDFPDKADDTVEIFINSLIHAREPQGMMTLIYFIRYLVQRYHSDPLVNFLVNNLEIMVIPVVNPDGYYYNEQTHPSGYGMWRKNRWSDGMNTWGVDLNRNFGYRWGYDDIGSSSLKNFETFRGLAPFSEPETQVIRDLCINHRFRIALNYHTYSNLLIFPWSYADLKTEDDSLYRLIGSGMIAENNFIMGGSLETVQYPVNGAADDWMYAESDQKNKILSMTMEVGTDRDGFWPSRSRILPLAQYSLNANLCLMKSALAYPKFQGVEIMGDSGFYHPGDSLIWRLSIVNAGLDPAPSIRLYTVGDVDDYSMTLAMNSQQQMTIDSLSLVIPDSIRSDHFSLGFCLEWNGVVFDSISFRLPLGDPVILIRQDFEQAIPLWTLGSWGVLEGEGFRSSTCLCDSPHGNYVAYADHRSYSPNVRIPVEGRTYMSVQTRYQMERYFDWGCVFFEDSADGQLTNLRLPGMIRGTGNEWQSDQQFGYQGEQPGWKRVWIDLSRFGGRKGRIQFRLSTDSYQHCDGWFIDDFYIVNYPPDPTSISETEIPDPLIRIFPNPAQDQLHLEFTRIMPTRIEIFNLLGRKMPVNCSQTTISLTGYPIGIYGLVTHYPGGITRVTKFMVLR